MPSLSHMSPYGNLSTNQVGGRDRLDLTDGETKAHGDKSIVSITQLVIEGKAG